MLLQHKGLKYNVTESIIRVSFCNFSISKNNNNNNNNDNNCNYVLDVVVAAVVVVVVGSRMAHNDRENISGNQIKLVFG